ncbi:MAG TPA: hypothetical protein VKZ79_03545 [Alphaproteobacteria bacterium]|nr:hypothetical protein [Alphaproteobacteria bacterium]
MSREAIQSALFALLTDERAGIDGLVLASRRLKAPQDVGPGNCPALFQIYRGETVEWSGTRPLKRIMHLEIVLFVHSGDKSFPTSSLLNPMLDAIDQAFGAGDPANVQTLGGLAKRVTINGHIATDEGLLGEYAYAIVPVEILIP